MHNLHKAKHFLLPRLKQQDSLVFWVCLLFFKIPSIGIFTLASFIEIIHVVSFIANILHNGSMLHATILEVAREGP